MRLVSTREAKGNDRIRCVIPFLRLQAAAGKRSASMLSGKATAERHPREKTVPSMIWRAGHDETANTYVIEIAV
jgi:hypothetical protein